jgi:hypothetical protein
MTKRWSSTASMDGQTKAAGIQEDSQGVRGIHPECRQRADREPPEASFDNVEDMLAWLDGRRDCPWKCKQGDPKCLCVRSSAAGQ